MIASLLLSACLQAAPTPAPPDAAPAKVQPAAPAAPAAAAPAKVQPAAPAAPAAAAPAKAPPATAASKGPPAAPSPAAKAAKPSTAPAAPKGLVVVPTRRGRLEFSHKEHAEAACVGCHQGQETPARFGLKGVKAAHEYCVDCHKVAKKGPEKCSACHKRE